MQTLDAQATSNDYTDACTIRQVWNSAGGYGIVSGADAYVELQYVQHGPGSEQWTNEVHVPLNSPLTLLPGTTGIRFRSYKAGTPATVSAALAGEAEPPITLTNPGTVNVAGASTNYQHNGVFVGLEPNLDFEDASGAVWTVTDDGVNTRVKVSLAAIPGYQYGRTAFTAPVTVSATTEATANTIVTAPLIAFDGATVANVDFFAPQVQAPANGAGNGIFFVLYRDGASIGLFGILDSGSNIDLESPIHESFQETPAVGNRTYSVRAYRSNANGTVFAGAGGVGALVPGFIRVTRA